MTESVTFRASKVTAVVYAVFFLAGAALFFWFGLVASHANWLATLGCAALAAYYAVPLIRPGTVYLRLDEQGLEIGSRMRETLHIKWSEMQELRLDEGEESSAIRIIYLKWDGQRQCSIDNEYTTSLAEILWTLNKWRERVCSTLPQHR